MRGGLLIAVVLAPLAAAFVGAPLRSPLPSARRAPPSAPRWAPTARISLSPGALFARGGRGRAASAAASPLHAAAALGGDSAKEAPDWMPTKTERKKLLPLGMMFFCILFNYTILRNTKDVLVVTAAGAEIIPFLKTVDRLLTSSRDMIWSSWALMIVIALLVVALFLSRCCVMI